MNISVVPIPVVTRWRDPSGWLLVAIYLVAGVFGGAACIVAHQRDEARQEARDAQAAASFALTLGEEAASYASLCLDVLSSHRHHHGSCALVDDTVVCWSRP